MYKSSKNHGNSNNKRKQPLKCPNPVFEEWISEWRDDAVAKDLQSKHSYTKCLFSLRKYPLPLKSGKDCIILEVPELLSN
jgi:crossover junction endonuclease MUS81